jgi:hypothetical protein
VAQSRQEQRASYPLAAYNFRVIVGAETLSFAKVSGLSAEHQTVTYNHGLSFLEGELITKFHVEKFTTVTLERGVHRRRPLPPPVARGPKPARRRGPPVRRRRPPRAALAARPRLSPSS